MEDGETRFPRFGTLLVVGFIAVLLVGGCRGAPVKVPLPGTTLYPDDYRQSTREFLGLFRVAFEEESRSELTRMIDERYGGYSNGRQTLVNRIDQVFGQYEVLALDLTVEGVTPFRGFVTARTEWTLRWRCTSSNPDRGCPELSRKKEFPVKQRSGSTTFELVWKDGSWWIRNQQGNVLLGLFEPGNAVTR